VAIRRPGGDPLQLPAALPAPLGDRAHRRAAHHLWRAEDLELLVLGGVHEETAKLVEKPAELAEPVACAFVDLPQGL
jgi:hypothetical protein